MAQINLQNFYRTMLEDPPSPIWVSMGFDTTKWSTSTVTAHFVGE